MAPFKHRSQCAEAIRFAGLSVTPMSISLLTHLASESKAYTIKELLEALRRKQKPASKTVVFSTIYRTLLRLEKAKLVYSISNATGFPRYAYALKTETIETDRVMCENCKSLAFFPVKNIETLLKSIEKLTGYRNIKSCSAFVGTCRNCVRLKR